MKETIILYDLTNTCFAEDTKGCRKAKRGKSKQKRHDRPLVTPGLVIDEEGSVKASRIFEGNVSDPSTLISMINDIHEKTQKDASPLFVPKPTVVLDAGIASNENLLLLREKGFSSIVVSRSKPKDILKDLRLLLQSMKARLPGFSGSLMNPNCPKLMTEVILSEPIKQIFPGNRYGIPM